MSFKCRSFIILPFFADMAFHNLQL